MNEPDPAANCVCMRGITKRFPAVLANDRVDFTLRTGEVHALVGENGAGKTTLMNVLAGLYQPDEGSIAVNGQTVTLRSPKDAARHGIGMVHQQFMLSPALTVAENVVLGLDRPRFLISPRKIEDLVAQLAESHGLRVDPRAPVWQLSVGEQQRVEILKALARGATILILDEPTAVLSPQEAGKLFEAVHALAAQQRSVVLISHKLQDVLSQTDRVTVLRKGRVEQAGVHCAATSASQVAEWMIGAALEPHAAPEERPQGDTRLEVKSLRVMGDRGVQALRGVDLCLHGGRLTGIAAVAGSGQRELVEAIVGLRKATSGSIRLCGQEISSMSARQIAELGVAYIPEDRSAEGSVSSLSIEENLILKSYRQPPIAKGWRIDALAVQQNAQRAMAAFDIAAPTSQVPAGKLSGGNLQKVIVARELSAGAKLVVAVQPTRGLDLRATQAVHQRLLAQRAQGAAVLVVSEDLDELLTLSDQVIVMHAGRMVGEVDPRATSPEAIGMLMGGAA